MPAYLRFVDLDDVVRLSSLMGWGPFFFGLKWTFAPFSNLRKTSYVIGCPLALQTSQLERKEHHRSSTQSPQHWSRTERVCPRGQLGASVLQVTASGSHSTGSSTHSVKKHCSWGHMSLQGGSMLASVWHSVSSLQAAAAIAAISRAKSHRGVCHWQTQPCVIRSSSA